MEATTESRSATEFLEAEVEAWRSRRAVRPVATTGKVTVVRIKRRSPPSPGQRLDRGSRLATG